MSATPDRTTRPHPAYWVALAAVTLWFAARWPAAWYAYPFAGFQDEPYLVDVAHAMVRDGDPNPRFFNYPSLSFYLLAGVYAAGDLTGALPAVSPAQAAQRASQDEQGADAGPAGGERAARAPPGPSPDHYVWARLLVLLMATLTVPLTAELTRRLVGPLAGLAAACVLAVTPLFTTFSYLATVNPPLAMWCALAGVAAAGVLRGGGRAGLLLPGIAAGLALGTKYVSFPVALLAPLAHLLAPRPPGEALRWRPLVVFGLAAGVTLVCTTPYALFDLERFARDVSKTGEVYDFEGNWHFHEGEDDSSWSVVAARFQGRSFRTGPTLLAGLGLVWLACTRWRSALLLALPPLFTWAFLGSYRVFFPRNLMGALPYACALAGAGTAALHAGVLALGNRFAGRRAGEPGVGVYAAAGLATVALFAWALANPLATTRAEIREDLQVDTRRAALEWVDEHVPRGAVILREERTPPLEELLEGYDVRYVRSLARPDRLDEADAADFVLLTVPFRRDVRQVDDYAEDRAAYERFMARHRLAAEFIGGEGRLSGRRIAIYAVGERP